MAVHEGECMVFVGEWSQVLGHEVFSWHAVECGDDSFVGDGACGAPIGEKCCFVFLQVSI